MVLLAIKVSFPLNSAIVFTRWLFKLNSNPVARGKMGNANKADYGTSTVREADDLTGGVTRHGCRAWYRKGTRLTRPLH